MSWHIQATCDRKQSLGPFRFQRCSTPLLDAVDADAVDAVDPVDTAFEVFVLPTAMARSTRGCSLAGAELPQPMENPLRQVGAGNPEFGAADFGVITALIQRLVPRNTVFSPWSIVKL